MYVRMLTMWRVACPAALRFVTKLQMTSLIGAQDAPVGEDGKLNYKKYLPKMTTLVKGMSDPEAIRERIELMTAAEFQPVELMNGKDKEAMTAMFEQLFREADADK